MTAQEWRPGDEARVVLAEFLIENRARGHKISAYLFDPYPMADALLAAGWTHPDLLPVRADDATIERAEDVITEAMRDTRAEVPGLTIGDATIHTLAGSVVQYLAAAGLLAGVRTGRSEQVGECGDTGPGSDFGYPKLAACRLPVGHPGDHSDSPRGGRSEAETVTENQRLAEQLREFMRRDGHTEADIAATITVAPDGKVVIHSAAQGTDTEGGETHD